MSSRLLLPFAFSSLNEGTTGVMGFRMHGPGGPPPVTTGGPTPTHTTGGPSPNTVTAGGPPPSTTAVSEESATSTNRRRAADSRRGTPQLHPLASSVDSHGRRSSAGHYPPANSIASSANRSAAESPSHAPSETSDRRTRRSSSSQNLRRIEIQPPHGSWATCWQRRYESK